MRLKSGKRTKVKETQGHFPKGKEIEWKENCNFGMQKVRVFISFIYISPVLSWTKANYCEVNRETISKE